MNKLKALFAVPALAVASVSAHAAGTIDVTPLDGTKADVALVGAAVFGVLIAVAGFKYVRRLL